MGLRDLTRIVRYGNKNLHPLSHLISPAPDPIFLNKTEKSKELEHRSLDSKPSPLLLTTERRQPASPFLTSGSSRTNGSNETTSLQGEMQVNAQHMFMTVVILIIITVCPTLGMHKEIRTSKHSPCWSYKEIINVNPLI